MSEKAWVKSLVACVQQGLHSKRNGDARIVVKAGVRLPYSGEIQEYAADGTPDIDTRKYETDLLVRDETDDGRWLPRVVIEFKLGSTTTHDALTYSTKAATHKHVHPYLRYGILLGDRKELGLPGRLVRHGAYFDFMVAWRSRQPTSGEQKDFCGLLLEEVKASRKLQQLLATSRKSDRTKYNLLRRPLILHRPIC